MWCLGFGEIMIVVGTTLAPYIMSEEERWKGWLFNARQLRASTEEEICFFAAIEIDSRGIDHFAPLVAELNDLSINDRLETHWTFSLDDGSDEITTGNRLRRITTGQNLVTDFSVTHQASHLLFMAADCSYPENALNELIELDHPLVGGHVPTYCLDGPVVEDLRGKYGDLVREHMATAAFVLLRSDLFNVVRWRWDHSMSDDPCLHYDADRFHGVKTYVHHGVLGRHYPECIGSMESRYSDRKIRKA
jgi:hypothetical protein